MWVADLFFLWITLILAVVFCYTQEDICIHSNATVENVTNCPGNATAIKERSEKKRCDVYQHCQDKQLVYHCTRYDKKLVEVCAPKQNITGSCCTLFEKLLGRVIEDYTKNCSECPFKYHSDESLKFSECVDPAMFTSLNQTSKQVTNQTTEMTSSSSAPTPKQKEKNWTFISIIITIIVGTVLVLFVIFIVLKKCRNGALPQMKSTDLLTENECYSGTYKKLYGTRKDMEMCTTTDNNLILTYCPRSEHRSHILD